MEELASTTRQSIREKISWKIVALLKPLYMLLRCRRKSWDVKQEELANYPEGSLGREMFEFLQSNELKLMPKAEFHDVYHVLFGYGTSIREEACIQYVPLGNGRLSLPLIACTITSSIFYPEYWSDFYTAFQRGRQAVRFHDWDFELMLKMPIEEVRKCVFNE